MQVESLRLSGLMLIRPHIFHDRRGFFIETYNAEAYRALGIDNSFVQDNHSRSFRGTLRGIHFQSAPGQAKLIRVVRGAVFDVAVDIRPQSATFGQWHGTYLHEEEHTQLYLPIGFAHGFCVISDVADVLYKTSSPYRAATECTIAWNDPDLGIAWPVSDPILSVRDAAGESFKSVRAKLG